MTDRVDNKWFNFNIESMLWIFYGMHEPRDKLLAVKSQLARIHRNSWWSYCYISWVLDYRVNQPIVLCLKGGHEKVTVSVLHHLFIEVWKTFYEMNVKQDSGVIVRCLLQYLVVFQWIQRDIHWELTCDAVGPVNLLAVKLLENSLNSTNHDFIGLNLDICSLALGSTQGLVNHYPAVWQAVSLPLQVVQKIWEERKNRACFLHLLTRGEQEGAREKGHRLF